MQKNGARNNSCLFALWRKGTVPVMAIESISAELCSGCGRCVMVCPTDVIRTDPETNKATVCYPKDCVMCFWCLSECSQNAVIMSAAGPSPVITSWG